MPQSLVRNFWHFGSCGAGFWLRSLVAIFQFPFRGCRDRFDDGWFTISRSKKAREPGGHRPPGEKRLVAWPHFALRGSFSLGIRFTLLQLGQTMCRASSLMARSTIAEVSIP